MNRNPNHVQPTSGLRLSLLLILFVSSSIPAQQAKARDDAAIAAMEKKILQVLTPEQTTDYLRGADPAQILLPSGENLAELISRLERSLEAGLVYKPVEPCLIFDTRKLGARLVAGDTRALLVRGARTDYSQRGGSAGGCGIPGLSGEGLKTNIARVLFLNVEVFDAEGPGELAVWPDGGSPEPASGLLTYADIPYSIGFKSSVAVAMCDEQSANPCEAGDLKVRARESGAHVAISVLGYFESAKISQSVFQNSIRIEGNGNDVLYVGTNGSYSYINSWDTTGTARDLFLSGNVGIKTISPQADLHVTGGTGSVELLVEADTDNSGEGDQPSLTLSQDGGVVQGQIGYFNSTNHLKVINNYGGAKVLLKENGDVCIGTNC